MPAASRSSAVGVVFVDRDWIRTESIGTRTDGQRFHRALDKEKCAKAFAHSAVAIADDMPSASLAGGAWAHRAAAKVRLPLANRSPPPSG